MAGLLKNAGAQPNRPPRYAPLYTERFFTGLFTQRNPLHDPSDIATAHFYGGRPDALLGGVNIELTNRLTLQRRPGLIPFSDALYPTPPNRAFSFELTNGEIQVIVDTGSTPVFNLTSVATSVEGTAVYTGAITDGSTNSFAGLKFLVAGFDQQTNNGTYTCVVSTDTELILDNPTAVSDTSAATAVSTGGVYWDHQDEPALAGVTLDGSSGQVTTAVSPSFQSTFSVSCWVRSTSAMSGTFVELNSVSGTSTPSTTFTASLGMSAGGLPILTTTVGQGIIGTVPVNDGVWHFVVGTYDGTTASIYVDGVLASSGPLTAATTFTGYWRIGNGAGSSLGFFPGTISAVAVALGVVWAAAQIDTEYITMAQSGPGGYVPFLGSQSYWSLFETSGTVAIDTVGSNNGTYTGGFVLNQIATVVPKTLLFAKSAGAGQTGFVAVAGTLYMGDGVDTRKYTPLNNNGTTGNDVSGFGSVWNYTIAAPVVQPVVTIVESGASAVAWQASTFFSTMGLLVDSNGNIESLTGVNNSGTNTTQFGTTGQGQPQWSNVTGNPPASGEDGTVNWLCAGPLALWTPQTAFAEGQCIYVPGIGGTPLPFFSGDGRGVNCPGTTGGGIWQAFPHNGTSSNAAPKFNPVSNTHTDDNNIEWQYLGPAILWQPLHLYNSWWEHLQMCIVEPALPNATMIENGTQQVFVQTANNQNTGSNNVPGTSGTGYTPPWPAAANTTPASVGQTTGDGDLQWICLGYGTWQASTEYVAWTAGITLFSAIKDSNSNFQVAIQGGLSGSTAPVGGFLLGTHYNFGQIIAVKSPSGYVKFNVINAGTTSSTTEPTWNYTSGSLTNSGGVTFRSQGLLAASVSVWGLTYGSQTTDGTVVWTNVGSAVDSTWTADTRWYLPAIGFTAPTSSQAYGGAEVVADGDVQIVIDSGLSGSSQPFFGAIGTTTQDNFALWYTDAAQSIQSLSWTEGHVYAYSYKSRSLDDFYSVESFVYTGPGQSTFQIPIPPGLNSALPPPTGSETGGISTASPVFTIVGANAGAVNGVKVTGSLDPQVDTIVIWRDADGGGPDNMFELTEIPNPAPVNGAPGIATFQDFLPDVATTSATGVLYPGLNPLIPAPIDDSNDPPPDNFVPQVYNFQRIFGISGQNLPWSGGPDTLTGNSAEAYLPSDNFPYLANLVRIVKTAQAMVVFLTDSVEALAGGPATNSFYTVTLAPGIGLGSYNNCDVYAGEIVFMSSDSQLKSINPSLQLANLGFPIGDQLATFNSSIGYVAIHDVAIDNAFYVTDGSTGWYRCNPRQIPGGINGPDATWSPFASITGGAGMVESVEVTPGQKKLLVGGTGCNQQILERNLDIFTDNNTSYPANFTMGSFQLVYPGELAALAFLEADFSGQNFKPTVSYLLNEISGTFTPFNPAFTPQFSPPSLYGVGTGPLGIPQSYSPQRYYWAAQGSIARARHFQLNVDFGTNSTGSEMINLTVFGKIMVEI